MLYRGLKAISYIEKGSAVAIGNFDGVHLGHQELIKKLISTAKKYKVRSTVILFEPHPKEYFAVQGACSRIMSLKQKYNRLRQLGVDDILCLKFNHCLINMTHEYFYNEILKKGLAVSSLILGENFCFGKNRLGNIAFLKRETKKDKVSLCVISSLLYEKKVISSTLLRQFLISGDFFSYNKFTGQNFCLYGKIHNGKIFIPNKRLPIDGLYEGMIDEYNLKVDLDVRSLTNGRRYIHITDLNPSFNKKVTVTFLSKVTIQI